MYEFTDLFTTVLDFTGMLGRAFTREFIKFKWKTIGFYIFGSVIVLDFTRILGRLSARNWFGLKGLSSQEPLHKEPLHRAF